MEPSNGPAAIMAVLVLVLLLATGVYDVAVAYSLFHGRTVSVVFYSWAQQFPIMPLFVGVILGHLFWPVFPR